jgi:hypothetical protein
MIHVNIRGLSKLLPAALMLALMTGSVHAGQDPEPTYAPEGTWLAIGTLGPLEIPFMDTYASLHNQHGLKGTVICTLNFGFPFLLPLGPNGTAISVIGTQTGQGNWVRVEKNVYAFTAWRMLLGPNGNVVGWAKFWGSIRPDAPDHFLGDINVAFYTLDFVPVPAPPMSAATEGWRVEVEGQ